MLRKGRQQKKGAATVREGSGQAGATRAATNISVFIGCVPLNSHEVLTPQYRGM